MNMEISGVQRLDARWDRYRWDCSFIWPVAGYTGAMTFQVHTH